MDDYKREIMAHCKDCDKPIMDGEAYYNFGSVQFCEQCGEPKIKPGSLEL